MSRKINRLLAIALATTAASFYLGGFTQDVNEAAGTPLPDLTAQSLGPRNNADNFGTVPVGVCTATFLVQGAGGEGPGGIGGKGGLMIGSVPVSAGDVLSLSAGSRPMGGMQGMSSIALLVGGAGFYGGGAGSAFLVNNFWAAVAGGGGGFGSDFSATGGDAGAVGVSGGVGSAGLGGAGGSVLITAGTIDATGPNASAGGGGGGAASNGSAGTGNSGGGGGGNFNPNLSGTALSFNGTSSTVTDGKVEVTYSICPVPSQPGNISLTSTSTTTAGISFPASTESGIPVTGYRYAINGGSIQNLTTSGSSTISSSISGLTPGSSNTLSVQPAYVVPNIQAETNRGQTALGAARTFTFNTPLSSPTNLVASAGNGSAVVNWTNPVDFNFSETVITAQPGGQTCTTTGTTCSFSNLVNGTSYTFSGVSNSVNAGAASQASAASNAVIPNGPLPLVQTQASGLSYTGNHVSMQIGFGFLILMTGAGLVWFRKFTHRRG